jgi:hypothetical protein
LASPRTHPAAAPQLLPICSARQKFVHCGYIHESAFTVGVAVSRDLRGVGRRLEGAYLDTVRANSRLIINQSYIMSKRSLFWGNGSGKLGEAVYYRAGGEQRTRAYVKNVKNPKSYQQALQRTKFNNLVGCFKGISTAVKSFYTNRASNQSPFNAFFRKNWPLNLWVTDKEITGVNEGVFQGLYVADGNLNLDTTITVESPTLADPNYCLTWTVPAGNYTIPVGTDSAQIVVGSELYQLLVGETNPYGLPSEFYVSVLLFQQGYASNAAQVFSIRCAADSADHFRYIQGSPKLPVPTQAQMDRLLFAGDGTITAPAGSTAGTAVGVSKICIGNQSATEAGLDSGAAVVVSFKDASGKRCTRSVVTYGKALQDIASDYTPSGEVGRSIISQYEVANTLIE